MIYLDYCANTPADPRVLEAFVDAERKLIGNANAAHAAGREAAALLDAATGRIAAMLGAAPSELIYTSGASEANNLAVKGIARAQRHVGRHIITTPLEHASVSAPLTALQEQGWEIDVVAIDRGGKIDLAHLRQLLRQDTALLTVSAVDSELGTIQPLAQIVEILKEFPDCKLHVDATQAVGKLPPALAGVDTMSLSAHKFYGLNGVGLLYKRDGLALEPLIHGGKSTTIYRSGTPTVALDHALAAAMAYAFSEADARLEIVKAHHAFLRTALAAYGQVTINSPADAVPHILNLSVRGIKGAAFQAALAEKGVCVSVKSACSSDGLPSRAVYAVSRDRKTALSAWRISLSHLTTREELSEFLKIFDTCIKELT
ncbi:MAG: cysteine desulfurase [Clostridia bacterium]|nr:cysteine desulfurase [Clostridia bacterium]